MAGSSVRTPLVSVVMPARNAAETIAASLQSLLGQTYGAVEILVIDDESADATGEIVASFRDRRVRLLRNEMRLGIAASLNRGIAEATGDFIARMDSDDIALPRRLQRQMSFLQRHPDLLAVGTAMRRIDERGAPGRLVTLPTSNAELRWTALWGAPLHHPTVLLPRRVFDELGLSYRTPFEGAEDYDLWVELMRHGPIANLPTVELLYRTLPRHVAPLDPARRHLHEAIARRHAEAVFGPASPALPPVRWLVRRLLLGGPCSTADLAQMTRAFGVAIGAYCAAPSLAGHAGERLLFLALKGQGGAAGALAALTILAHSPRLFAAGAFRHARRRLQGLLTVPSDAVDRLALATNSAAAQALLPIAALPL